MCTQYMNMQVSVSVAKHASSPFAEEFLPAMRFARLYGSCPGNVALLRLHQSASPPENRPSISIA